MMRAGKLDHTIVIQSYTAGAPNAAGASSPGYSTFATVRAEIVQGSANETLPAYGEIEALRITFRVRWLAGVTTKHNVRYDGHDLNIREIVEIGRRRGLELRCEEVRP